MIHEIWESKYDEIITGAVKMMVPDIGLFNCRVEGDNPSETLIECNHRTKLHNIVAIGSPHGQHRGISVNATGIRINGFRVLNIVSQNQQTNGIAGWEGTNDLIIDSGEIEAASQFIMFGGAYCSHPMLIPQDILVQNITGWRNLAWKNDPSVACTNFYEVKNGKRIKFHNNAGRYAWAGGGQNGEAVVLTVRQDSPEYFCVIEDIDFYNNDFYGCNAGLNVMGVDDRFPDSPMAVKRIQFRYNTFRDMGLFEPNGRQFMLNNGSDSLHILSNRIFQAPGVQLNSIITFTNDQNKNKAMQFIGNDVPEGNYGVIGDGMTGVQAWEHFTEYSDWQNNNVRDQSGNVTYP